MERPEFEVIRAQLEQMKRRLRVALVGWGVSVVALGLLAGGVQPATSQPTVLRVRALEVVDEQGVVRIVLSADRVPGESEGGIRVAGMWLLDPAGRELATLGSTANGFASLSFRDPARPSQFGTLSLDGLILSDLKGTGRIQLASDGVSLWDSERRMRMLLAIYSDNGVGLTFFDPTGRLRNALDVHHDGKPALTLFDGTGQKLFGAP